MEMRERVALTEAMRDSGCVLDWRDLPGPALDKHSTGGVGDTVSLMLAPAVAACGGFVPMISGRGLGHTGGTLDKLDAIPGYISQPDEARFRKVTREVGCAIIGQTADLAPADRRFYGIRDVTATVESIPLITASILSKKLAAGLSGLVMDVKFGSGAFMERLEDARELARSLATVATGAGLPTTALLTDMNEPLGSAAGNALEVRYAIEYLTGARRETRMHDIVCKLGGFMLVRGKLVTDVNAGIAALKVAIESGKATEVFQRMVSALGGPVDLVERPEKHLAAAPIIRPVPALDVGHIVAVDSRALGLTVVTLGGGRTRAADSIDHTVGLTDCLPIGAPVGRGDPLAIVHARTDAQAVAAVSAVQAAYTLGSKCVPASPVVAEWMDGA
jgi:thymidine phosphorylase